MNANLAFMYNVMNADQGRAKAVGREALRLSRLSKFMVVCAIWNKLNLIHQLHSHTLMQLVKFFKFLPSYTIDYLQLF